MNEKIQDLRTFLQQVKNQAPEEIVEINQAVIPQKHEVSTLLDILREKGKFPLLKLNRITDLNGGPFAGEMVISADPGSYRRAAIAFDLPLDRSSAKDVIEELGKRTANPLKPQVVDSGSAPVKEVIWTGEEADIGRLPLLLQFEDEMRPGWCTPVVAFPHPDTGRVNLAYHRVLYHGPQRLTMKIGPESSTHAAEYYKRALEKGENLPFAGIIGHHPGFYQGAAISTPWAIDEYDQASGTLGQPLRLVPSETFGEKLMVPADAEIIIEGYLTPERDNEGPFGEWPRYYGRQCSEPVGVVTAITMRKRPVFQAIWSSYHMLEDIAHSVGLYHWIKMKFPRLTAASSLFHTWAVLSIKKFSEGEALRVANLALGYGWHVKYVIVVDEDINPFDLREVWWAISMRAQPDQAVQILRNVRGNVNDPSSTHPTTGSVMIIDATEPVDRPFEKRVAVPGEVRQRLVRNLSDYIDTDTFRQIPVRDRWTY